MPGRGPDDDGTDETGGADAAAPANRTVLRRAVTWLIVAAFAYAVISLARRVDWDQVRSALGHFAWWQLVLLAGVLCCLRWLNALPLAIYIPGVSTLRALQNDVAAALMSMVAPPPSDIVLRVSMFNSWGVDTSLALAGTVMNTVTFYLARFSAPAFGFVLLLALRGYEGDALVTALGCLVVVAVIVVSLLMVFSGEQPAAAVGTFFAKLVRRVKKSVDPAAWSAACVTFRDNMAVKARRGLPAALPSQWAMIIVDASIVLLCLRFVGVDGSRISAGYLYGAYLVGYPLTLFPFSGIGLFDAVLMAEVVAGGGEGVEAPALAALVVWRLFTILGPVLMGAVAVADWRRRGNGASQ